MNKAKKIAKKVRLNQRSREAVLTTRTCHVRAKSADDANRSVEAVLATDEPVIVADYGGRIAEVLVLDGVRHDEQVPLLDTHSRWTVRDVLGSTRDIRVEAGEPNKLIGRNYYADTPDGRDAYAKARDGHLTDNSVGYSIINSQTIAKGQAATIGGRKYTAPRDMPLRVTTEWRLAENSACPIGADKNAKNRNHNPENNPQHTELRTMLTDQQKQHIRSKGFDPETLTNEQCSSLLADFSQRTEPETPTPEDDPAAAVKAADKLRAEGMAAEQKRQSTIRTLAGDHIPTEMVERAITDGTSIDKAQQLFYAHMVEKRASNNDIHVPNVIVRDSSLDTNVIEAGLLLRGGGMDEQVAKDYGEQTAERADRDFRDLCLLDICRAACRLDGVVVPSGRDNLIRAALSTISLPQILGNTANKSLLRGYNAAEKTWNRWCNIGSVSDFKEHTRVRLTDVGGLEDLLPSGEFAHGSLTEEYETIQAKTKGKTLAISRVTFINDDLSTLTKVPMGMGLKAASKLAQMIYEHFMGNPTMSDATALFHADHSNLNTTTPLAAAGLGTAMKAFRAQTDADGESIDISPKYLLVPPTLEHTAKALLESDILLAMGLASTSAASTGPNKNTYKGCLDLIVENRLENSNYTNYSTADWYVTASPATADTVEVAFLNGRSTPYLDRYSNIPGFLGVVFQIYFDAGVAAQDWRTVQKNDAA